MKKGSVLKLSGKRKAVCDGHHFRIIDTLARLLRSNRIDIAAHDAGRKFAEDFHVADLCGLKAISLQAATGGGNGDTEAERITKAKQRVHRALQVVGGMHSPGGSALWHIIGLEQSVNEWAGNMRLDHREANAFLIAALYVIASSYGYTTTYWNINGNK